MCELGVMSRVARFVHNTRSPLPGVVGNPAIAEQMLVELPGVLRILDDEVGARPFLAGDRPTIADCTLFGSWEFGRLFGFEPEATFANLHRWHVAFLQRPSASWNPDSGAL
jgi:glutathione S-transferase